jgi:hypothetical protein
VQRYLNDEIITYDEVRVIAKSPLASAVAVHIQHVVVPHMELHTTLEYVVENEPASSHRLADLKRQHKVMPGPFPIR